MDMIVLRIVLTSAYGSGWENTIPQWRNLVESLQVKYPDWAHRDDTYKLIDAELRTNYGGHLDFVNDDVSSIIFDSEGHKNWFILKFS